MIDSIRERVRLAEGLNRDGTLNQAAISRALAAMELFHDFSQAVGLDELDLIATSAVRDASNRDEILVPLRAMGFEPKILEGSDEAAYGVLAVANTTSLDNAWVIDQGGGSLQISLMENRQFVMGEAFPLGTLRLTEGFLSDQDSEPTNAAQVRALEHHLEHHLGGALERIIKKPYPLVCMGGTVRNLANIVQKQQAYPLTLLHGYRLKLQPLEQLTRRILQKTVSERMSLPGLSADRADVIAAGAATFRWILRRGKLSQLAISGAGVREGALLRRLLPEPHLFEEVRKFSVGNLLSQYPQPEAHTESVRTLALSLFDELRELHGFGDQERELLEAAAILHDIGMAVSYYRHHRYGSFLLEAAGLEGYRHREIALISLMIRYHRKGTPSWGALSPLSQDDDEERRLWVLTACLRLAEHLERSRTGRVQGVSANIDVDLVSVEILSASEPTVELWEANKDSTLFELAFERRLELSRVATT